MRRRGTIPASLRVLTWNLWWRYGDWEKRSVAIHRVLSRQAPDIAALQEVWTVQDASQASEIAQALDMYCVDATPWSIDGIGLGNAVLSRWPIQDAYSRLLPLAASGEQRLVLVTKICTSAGPISVLSTHLDWREEDLAVRLEQARVVFREALGLLDERTPTIICADFNAESDSEVLAEAQGPDHLFRDAWREARGDSLDGATWDLVNPHAGRDCWPSRRIDFILVGSTDRKLEVQSARLFGDAPIDGIWPSDHNGVSVDLAIPSM
jgi:endonuclease/exonuclease/phosphatase family metal-dependent hydrolase